ncbi:MAG: hypothetical protein GY737_08085 [Desulfobacteraceae bacterium]|nr:hypothetical protein [Desulfobacteraceae bacterium]
MALHFEFTKVGCASIRNVCNFLELTQLSRIVAPSYGTHQKISDQMDIMIGKFGDKEEARLSILMEENFITIWKMKPCLSGCCTTYSAGCLLRVKSMA